ncbi:MAG TPA: energy-coupling factor transporter transmembrane component T [Desulfomonilaceae bacterium]|nr:energy-coupling factor transporter transmembrane component T [Desulfomonilaceae bacterium]
MSMLLQDISIGGYLPASSVLHRLDPRTKLAGFGLLLVCTFSTGSIQALIFNAAAIVGIVCVSGIGFRVWWWGLARFSWMLVITAALNAFLHKSGAPFFLMGHELPLTYEGTLTSMLFVANLAQAVLLSMALTFTTTPRDLTRGCQRLAGPLKRFRVPVDEIGVVLLLAMRFVPLLQLELRSIIDAQESRGIDFHYGGIAARARNLAAVLVPALLGALRRGDLLADAMAARGFRPAAARSDFNPLRFSRLDRLALVSLVVFFLCRVCVFK